jgi:hypothetical protein
LRLQDQEGRCWRRLSEDKKWSQRFELSGLGLLLGQPRKAVDSKQDKTFSYSNPKQKLELNAAGSDRS